MDTLNARERVLLSLLFLIVGGLTVFVFRFFNLSGKALVAAPAVVGVVAILLVSKRRRQTVTVGTAMTRQRSGTATIPGNLAGVHARLADLIARTPRWEAQPMNSDAHLLEIRTGMSFRSFGEIVQVRLQAEGPALTRVEVTSMSSVATTMFDFGKNRSNVVRVLQWLND